MTHEIGGAILITLIALIARHLEEIKRFNWSKGISGERVIDGCEIFYHCCNVHLHLSLGMLGLLWSQHSDTSFSMPLFILILIGIGTKAAVSGDKPERISLKDKIALCGLFIPNVCALASAVFVVLVIYFNPIETDTEIRKSGLPPVLLSPSLESVSPSPTGAP